MRVMCICTEAPEMAHAELIRAANEMYVGRVVTVIDSDNDEYGGWYEFDEYPDLYWYQKNFAPVSDIDETEMIRENIQPATV